MGNALPKQSKEKFVMSMALMMDSYVRCSKMERVISSRHSANSYRWILNVLKQPINNRSIQFRSKNGNETAICSDGGFGQHDRYWYLSRQNTSCGRAVHISYVWRVNAKMACEQGRGCRKFQWKSQCPSCSTAVVNQSDW